MKKSSTLSKNILISTISLSVISSVVYFATKDNRKVEEKLSKNEIELLDTESRYNIKKAMFSRRDLKKTFNAKKVANSIFKIKKLVKNEKIEEKKAEIEAEYYNLLALSKSEYFQDGETKEYLDNVLNAVSLVLNEKKPNADVISNLIDDLEQTKLPIAKKYSKKIAAPFKENYTRKKKDQLIKFKEFKDYTKETVKLNLKPLANTFISEAHAVRIINDCKVRSFNDPKTPETSGSAYLSFQEDYMYLSDKSIADLEHLKKPIDIYNYVKTKIKTKLYHGARNSAESTYLAKEGSVLDKNILLASLLRRKGYATRFVKGNILLEEEQLAEYWQVQTSNAIEPRLSTIYRNYKATIGEALISISGDNYVKIPHFWVEVYTPNSKSRGLDISGETKAWIPIDVANNVSKVKKTYQTYEEIYERQSSYSLMFDTSFNPQNITAYSKIYGFDNYLFEKSPLTDTVLKNELITDIALDNFLRELNKIEDSSFFESFSSLQNGSVVSYTEDEILPIGPMGVEACIKAKSPELFSEDITRYKLDFAANDNTVDKEITLELPNISHKMMYVIYSEPDTNDFIKPELYLDDTKVFDGIKVGATSANPPEIKATMIFPEENYDELFKNYWQNADSFIKFNSISGTGAKCSTNEEQQYVKNLDHINSIIENNNIESMSSLERKKLQGKILYNSLLAYCRLQRSSLKSIETVSNTRFLDNIVAMTMFSDSDEVVYIGDKKFGFVPTSPSLSIFGRYPGISANAFRNFDSMEYSYQAFFHHTINVSTYLSSVIGSSLEDRVIQDYFSVPGVSTVSLIQRAKDEGYPIRDVIVAGYSGVESELLANYPTAKPEDLGVFRELTYDDSKTRIISVKDFDIDGKKFTGLYSINDNLNGPALINGARGGIGLDPSEESGTGYDIFDFVNDVANYFKDFFDYDQGVDSNSDSYATIVGNGDSDEKESIENGLKVNKENACGQPVNLNNGNMWHEFIDIPNIALSGYPLEFKRVYSAQDSDRLMTLGYGWRHNFNSEITSLDNSSVDLSVKGGKLKLITRDGNEIVLHKKDDSNSEFVVAPIFDIQVEKVNNTLVVTNREKEKHTYSLVGSSLKLTELMNRAGFKLAIEYVDEKISRVSNNYGQEFSFIYSGGLLVRINDNLGRKVTFEHDVKKDLITSFSLDSTKMTYEYTSKPGSVLDHNLISFKNDRGDGVRYFYFNNDKLFKHVEGETKETVYSYNTINNETTVIKDGEFVFRYLYDLYGNVIRRINPDDTFHVYKYNLNGKRILSQDEDGYITQSKFDSNYNLSNSILPDNLGEGLYYYNSSSNLLEQKLEADGSFENYQYNNLGQLTSVVRYKKRIFDLIEPSSGKKIDLNVAKSRIGTTDLVNLFNNQSESVDLLFTYTDRGDVASEKGFDDFVRTYNWTYELDGSASVKVYTSHKDTPEVSALVEEKTFDRAGRLLTISNRIGEKNQFSYFDDNTIQRSENLTTGTIFEFKYDESNNKTEEKLISEDYTVTNTFFYNKLNSLTEVKENDVVLEKREYDFTNCECGGEERPSAVFDSKGNKTSYKYNWRNDVVEIVYPNMVKERREYSNRGELSSVVSTTKTGEIVSDQSFKYSALGQYSEKINTLGRGISRTQDRYNPLITPDTNTHAFHPYSNEIKYTEKIESDSRGRVTSYKSQSSDAELSRFDGLGYLTQSGRYTQSYDDKTLTQVVEDNYSKITRVNNFDGTVKKEVIDYKTLLGINPIKVELDFSYENFQLKEVKYNGKAIRKYEYGANKRLSKLVANNNQSFDISYSDLGNLKGIDFPNGLSSKIKYTSNGLLEEVSVGGKFYERYRFDDNKFIQEARTSRGNFQYDYDTYGQLISSLKSGTNLNLQERFVWNEQGINLGFDNDDSVTNTPRFSFGQLFKSVEKVGDVSRYNFVYDDEGRVYQMHDALENKLRMLEYTNDNKLEKVIIFKRGKKTVTYRKWGGGVATRLVDVWLPEKTVQLFYDGYGRKIARQAIDEVGNKTSELYVYRGENLLFVLDESGEIKQEFISLMGIDEYVGYNINGKSYYLHKNNINSVVAITNSSGEVSKEVIYKAFGEVEQVRSKVADDLGSTQEEFLNRFNLLYTSRFYDKDIKLFDYRNRYYHAGTGRFISTDPIGLQGNDTNLYRYINNNPINFSDPFGLFGVFLNTGGAVGGANSPNSGKGKVIEASSGIVIGSQDGGIGAAGIISSGQGTNIAGATGGIGLSVGFVKGDISNLAGAGTSSTTVIGGFSTTVIRNAEGEFVGGSFGFGGKGLGLSEFKTETTTVIGEGVNTNACK